MSYRRWTDGELAVLWRLKAKGWTREQIAGRLGRTWRSVKHQLESWHYD